MLVKNVTSTDSLENVTNGKFVFCKELKKGFIKGDLSSSGLTDYSFSNVASVIEGLTLAELEAKGLNTVIFVNGEEKISQKMNLEMEELATTLTSDWEIVDIQSLIESKRLFSDYFLTQIFDSAIEASSIDIDAAWSYFRANIPSQHRVQENGIVNKGLNEWCYTNDFSNDTKVYLEILSPELHIMKSNMKVIYDGGYQTYFAVKMTGTEGFGVSLISGSDYTTEYVSGQYPADGLPHFYVKDTNNDMYINIGQDSFINPIPDGYISLLEAIWLQFVK